MPTFLANDPEQFLNFLAKDIASNGLVYDSIEYIEVSPFKGDEALAITCGERTLHLFFQMHYGRPALMGRISYLYTIGTDRYSSASRPLDGLWVQLENQHNAHDHARRPTGEDWFQIRAVLDFARRISVILMQIRGEGREFFDARDLLFTNQTWSNVERPCTIEQISEVLGLPHRYESFTRSRHISTYNFAPTETYSHSLCLYPCGLAMVEQRDPQVFYTGSEDRGLEEHRFMRDKLFLFRRIFKDYANVIDLRTTTPEEES